MLNVYWNGPRICDNTGTSLVRGPIWSVRFGPIPIIRRGLPCVACWISTSSAGVTRWQRADALCELQPDCAQGFALRSGIHRHQGALLLAAEDVARLVRVDTSAELRWFMLLASLWMQLERPADAVAALTQAEDRFGPIPSIEEARARAWAAQGEMAAAGACLQRLHLKIPELAFRWWMLEADLWAAQGNRGQEQQALAAAADAIQKLSDRKRNSQPVQTLQQDIARRTRVPGTP